MVILKIFTVRGDSMSPLLHEGKKVLASGIPYLFSSPQIGDLVIALDPRDGRKIIKKVIAIFKDKYEIEGENKEYSTDSREFGLVGRKEILAKVICYF